MTSTAFDRIFRDSNGEIVVAQPPNLPLIVTSGSEFAETCFNNRWNLYSVRLGSFWLFVYLGVGGIISRCELFSESARFLRTDWCDNVKNSQVILITFQAHDTVRGKYFGIRHHFSATARRWCVEARSALLYGNSKTESQAGRWEQSR